MNRVRPFSVRTASRIVKVVARAVPRSCRARWTEEWLGEIDRAAAGRRLIIRSLGSIPDALTCRRIAAVRSAPEPVSLAGDGILNDVRFGIRMMRRAPAFTAAAVASLAVGIAATTTVFSAFNALLFRSLPGVHDSMRLAQVHTQAPWLAGPASRERDYQRYREVLTSFSDLAAFGSTSVAVGRGDEPFVARTILASENYFAVLGTTPAAGRLIDASVYDQPVAVVSHDFAERHFGSPVAAARQPLTLNGHVVQIIGVTPPWFGGVRPGDLGGEPSTRPQLWLPLSMRSALQAPATANGGANRHLKTQTTGEWVEIVGRLAPGITMSSARAQAASVPSHSIYSGRADGRPLILALGRGPHDSAGDIAVIAALILSIPAIVLAIGCANTANLQLARTAHRQTEVAVRRSLGATRGRIVRQLIVESLLVAALAGTAGIAGTVLLTKVLASYMPVPFPLDWRVLLFALAVSTMAGLGFGVAPALGATRGDLTTPLKDSAATPTYRRSRLRSGLVSAQIALSLLLLVMAGLFTRSLQRLHGLDSDRQMSRVAAATIDLSYMKYTDDEVRSFQEALLSRVEHTPGVVAAAIVPFEPFGATTGLTYSIPGVRENLPYRYTSGAAGLGRFVETAGVRVVAGRAFTDGDRSGSPKVALVSQSLAQQISPSGYVVGQVLLVGDGDTPATEVTVIGVTSDATFRVGSRESTAMFLPSPMNYDHTFSLWVRTNGDPEGILTPVRSLVRDLDRRLPIQIGTAESWRYRAVGPIRWIASGLGAMGALALALAGAGLYAVISYLVARRRHEMAIRLALGSTPRQLATLIISDGLRLSIPGVLIGALLSSLVARLARALLMGVSPFDPVAFGSVATLLVGVALTATLVPALRAARQDPLVSLRRQ